jgi:hypothetical protein
MVTRHGRRVAAHFGSATSEASVCLSTVGIADRSDRTTLEARGAPGDLDVALASLAALPSRPWFTRLSPGSALVRCEGADAPRCRAALAAWEGITLLERDRELAAIGVIGPRAEELLRAEELVRAEGRGAEGAAPILVRENDTAFELIVPAAQGPAQWEALLELGAPFQVACVGLEALEHLAVSRRVHGASSGARR